MATKLENVAVTIQAGSANPQVINVQVPVDTLSGTGSVTFTYTGVNPGLDTMVAGGVVNGQNLSSNVGQVSWAVPDVQDDGSYVWDTGGSHNYRYAIIAFLNNGTHTGSSNIIIFNHGHKCYLKWKHITPGVAYYLVLCTFTDRFDSDASTRSVGYITGDGSKNAGFHIFPAVGYPTDGIGVNSAVEIAEGSWFRYFGDGTPASVVNNTGVVPATSSETGKLVLSPSGGSPNQKNAGDQITLTVTLSGISYVTQSYLPIFEGVTGDIKIYNDPNSNVFNYPTYNGFPVNKSAAVTAGALNLNGDNGLWQGRLSIDFDGSNFRLVYNGAALPAGNHTDATTLTVTADDVAWFFNGNSSFDLFGITGTTGGVQKQLVINYMAHPSVASVSPLSVPADNLHHFFTINLDKPFSPQQQGALSTNNTVSTPGISFPGATFLGTPTPVIDGAGWLTGWTVEIGIPASSSNSTVNMGITVTGTLTYLNGSAFTVGGGVTYVSTSVPIGLVGSGFLAPVHYSSSWVTGAGSGVSVAVVVDTKVLASDTGSISTSYYVQIHGTSNAILMGTTNPQDFGPTPISGGYLDESTFNGFVPLPSAQGQVVDFGYTSTDTLSGLSVTHWDGPFTLPTLSGGGGGGGGGCPAVEMYVGETMQVSGCEVGDPLACLPDDPGGYLDGPMAVLPHEIQWMKTSTEVCYHFKAENGAEVIVSGSTPVTTREVLIALREGHPEDQLPIYANQIRSGMHVVTDVGNGPEWSMLEETFCVGLRLVARLYCGGHNFAAGVKPGKYIFTHNNVAAEVVK